MENLVQIKLEKDRKVIKLKSDPNGEGVTRPLNNETVMQILDPNLNNNHIMVATLDGSISGYINISHLDKVLSMNDKIPQMTLNYGVWLRTPGPPPQQQPTYVYRELIGIDQHGIQLRSLPYDASNEDGATLYNGQYVTHNAPAIKHSKYVYVFAYPRNQGYIHMKYLGTVSLKPRGENPPPPPFGFPPYVPPDIYQESDSGSWYMRNLDGTTELIKKGGLRRRKFRSHKKRHVKSRPRSNKSRSKKSCSRRH
jgi:hypothetical protein